MLEKERIITWILKHEETGYGSPREAITRPTTIAIVDEEQPKQYIRTNLQNLPKPIDQKRDEHCLYKIKIENKSSELLGSRQNYREFFAERWKIEGQSTQ